MASRSSLVTQWIFYFALIFPARHRIQQLQHQSNQYTAVVQLQYGAWLMFTNTRVTSGLLWFRSCGFEVFRLPPRLPSCYLTTLSHLPTLTLRSSGLLIFLVRILNVPFSVCTCGHMTVTLTYLVCMWLYLYIERNVQDHISFHQQQHACGV